MSNVGDLRISGSGSTAGGVFNTVSISGWGEVSGDIECCDFKISGSGRIKGAIKTENGSISGSGRVDGNIDAHDFTVSGSSHIGGNVTGKSFRVSGDTKIDGTLGSDDIKISGSVRIGSDCSAEVFRCSGLFNINGMLNAGIVDAELYHIKSHASDIGGEKITIRQGHGAWLSGLFKSLFTGTNIILETGSIEGDEIYLECTKANVVRGNNVTIGNGCDIGLIEYKGEFKHIGDSKITESRKI